MLQKLDILPDIRNGKKFRMVSRFLKYVILEIPKIRF